MDARVSFSLAYCSQRSRARARNGLRAVYRGNCYFNNTRAKEGEEGEGEDGRGVAKHRVHFEWGRKLPNLAWLLAIRRV